MILYTKVLSKEVSIFPPKHETSCAPQPEHDLGDQSQNKPNTWGILAMRPAKPRESFKAANQTRNHKNKVTITTHCEKQVVFELIHPIH